MEKRRFFKYLAKLAARCCTLLAADGTALAASSARCRVRASDPAWPNAASWEELNLLVGGNLVPVQSPLVACGPDASCREDLLKNLRNPYYIADEAGLTQISGWVDAWTAKTSAFVVAVRSTSDVVVAVNFARSNNLRLVIKGGGHSYQGTSNASDSLLISMRAANRITIHESFVADGCAGIQRPQPAVSIGAGALWMEAYHAVTTVAGRYVQGGGCATVGVAGLIQSGGFGSFSKRYGLAAAGLIEAEVVTADGEVLHANQHKNADLFWALKGGGGGSLGVITKVTLRTHELPAFFGGVGATIKAGSAAAFRRLIAQFIAFYNDRLLNPQWGESISLRPDNTLGISMVFHGLDEQQASAVWHTFFDLVAEAPDDFSFLAKPSIVGVPARSWWDPDYRKKHLPKTVIADSRPGAPESNIWWTDNQDEAGAYIRGYESAWLPAAMLKKSQQHKLVDAIFASSRHSEVTLHFNKGLAGAPSDAIAEARDTPMNPVVLEAFALAIIASGERQVHPGLGNGPDLTAGRKEARAIAMAMRELRRLLPNVGSYVSESNYFEPRWQQAFWGVGYPRLMAVKRKYDPSGLFFVHHGVGSEDWSADGFTRL
jgi:hypothetical protein